MTRAWLNIVGMGETGAKALPPLLQTIIAEAGTVLGPPRFLDTLDPSPSQKLIAWQSPLAAMIEQVKALRGTPTVILATGDPMWFGIAATLNRHLDPDEFVVHVAPSAFQLAAARLHWPLQNVATLSLHGRAVETIQQHIAPGARLLALTSDRTTVRAVADLLDARGYGRSTLIVLERLGADNERITATTASEFAEGDIGDFHTLAIDCVADPGADLLPPVPGLPDDAFQSDGQLTKRDVRAATLAKLAPYPGALLWDVGAGCGSVGVEWMRAARDASAIAFERDSKRLAMIARNKKRLGVPGLTVVGGPAPLTLSHQPAPDAVFLGGAVADEAVFAACWQALKPGGRLVANAVTVESEGALFTRQARFGGELTRLEVAVLDTVGDYRAFRPRMAVTQWFVIKDQAQ